jgi:hypothetical protein
MKDFPFKQTELRENLVLRTFTMDVDASELVWHMDREDRVVKVLEGNSWLLQMDNELPKKLIEGKEYFIPKMSYHRIFIGTGNLILEILMLI